MVSEGIISNKNKKVSLSFEIKSDGSGQRRTIKGTTDFDPQVPESLLTRYSIEFDETEPSTITTIPPSTSSLSPRQISDGGGGIQVDKSGRSCELHIENDNFELSLKIKPKYHHHWEKTFVEKVSGARKRMGFGMISESDASAD